MEPCRTRTTADVALDFFPRRTDGAFFTATFRFFPSIIFAAIIFSASCDHCERSFHPGPPAAVVIAQRGQAMVCGLIRNRSPRNS